MKKWNITIEAKDEASALELVKILKETFEVAAKFEQPLHHIYANMNGTHGTELICEESKK